MLKSKASEDVVRISLEGETSPESTKLVRRAKLTRAYVEKEWNLGVRGLEYLKDESGTTVWPSRMQQECSPPPAVYFIVRTPKRSSGHEDVIAYDGGYNLYVYNVPNEVTDVS